MKYYFRKKSTLNLGTLAECMWDRNEIVTPNSDILLLTPIGKLSSISFLTACENRGKELANLDSKIYVLWSGGLDSTTAFLVLREVVPAEQLAVLYTADSLTEYPGFFDAHIKGIHENHKFSMATMAQTMEKFCKLGVIVTGEIGDQLFGSAWSTTGTSQELKDNWKNFKYGALLKIPRVEQFVEACPKKIENALDVLWWFNYAMKYQYVQMRMLRDNTSTQLNSNIYHFFDTPDFNDYAVSIDSETRMPEFDMKNYKYPMREVIYKLSGDKEYAFNKPKVRSWNAHGNPLAEAIDTNWVRYADN
jgi:hypothetical protein